MSDNNQDEDSNRRIERTTPARRGRRAELPPKWKAPVTAIGAALLGGLTAAAPFVPGETRVVFIVLAATIGAGLGALGWREPHRKDD
jgi:hypothetical protein